MIKKPFFKFFSLALFLLISAWLGAPRVAWAQTPIPDQQVIIYLFWGEGCPHCAKAKPYFENLQTKYPGVVLREFEIYYDEDNLKLFTSMAKKVGMEQIAVPTIFIGPYYLLGYSEDLNKDIEAVVVQCLQNGCVDAGEGLSAIFEQTTPPVEPQPSTTPISQIAPTSTPPTGGIASETTGSSNNMNDASLLNIPLIGSVDLSMKSTLLGTFLIAIVDGVNPCSLWVLSMLLALTLHTGSRKKVLMIGLIFLTVTAGIYALFIAGLFSVLKVASFMGWVQILVAVIALFFALVNIKDYFWYKEGISFTIAEDQKPGIFKRIRSVINASQSFWGLASATVVLAAGVSLVEFSCTAGLPIIWVNLLSAQKVSGAAFLLLLLFYMLIYQFDELLIFFSAVASLKATRLEEKHGRVLKLISGMLLLTLSIVMLVNPVLMNHLGSSLVIFGIAFIATAIVLLVHRIFLPRFGIRIGTGPRTKDRSSKRRAETQKQALKR